VKRSYLITLALVIVSGAIGFFSGKHFSKNKERKKAVITEPANATQELRLSEYKLISPLLECDTYRPANEAGIVTLENRVKQAIDSAKNSGKISHVSFYYRDLKNGPWIGIGEKDNFSPASLLKVPIMIAVLKKAENEPAFLKTKIKYDKPFDTGLVPNVKDSTIKTGNTYSVETLIYKMIVHSDNEARMLLLQNIEATFLNKVYMDLGIDVSNFDDRKDFMSVKTYSSFFRLLYNATYLNRTNSEKALQILTHIDFRDGLPAMLPSNTIVAHKFGERGYLNANIRQLHDCGIVYKDNSPYLICIMTRGTDIKEQTRLIAAISGLVYNTHK
jgi:beta-lactamase class A